MIRSSVFHRLGRQLRRRGTGCCMQLSAAANTPHIVVCYLSTETAAAQQSAREDQNKNKPKFTSFFDQVDETMKRDSPIQYQRFLESKAASESWREMQRRNERSRSRSSRGGMLEREAEEVAMSNISYGASSSLSSSPALSAQSAVARDGRPAAFAKYDYDHDGEEDFGTASSATDREELPWYKQKTDISSEREADKDANHIHSDAPSTSTTLPNKYQNFMKKQDESSNANTTDIKHSDGTSSSEKKSGGVFSSISESTLNMRDANGVTSTSIPLSELFPTLYGKKDSQQDTDEENTMKKKKKPNNPAMMYDEDEFEAYCEAVEAVFADPRSVRAIKKFESGGSSGEEEKRKRMVQIVKDWLLNDHRIVEQSVVKKRWNNVEEVWKDEKWMTGIVGDGDKDEENKSGSRFRLELSAQQELFLSKLQEEIEPSLSSDESIPLSTEDSSDDRLEIDPKLFHEMTQSILDPLGRYCARRARSSPMVVAWSKIKESGLLLPKSTISTYLYVVSLMGMADSLGLGSSSSSSGIGISSYSISGDEKGSTGDSSNTNKEEDRFLIPEEVATYHDLASKPTESSISLRVKALASKGDAKEADKLLMAFQNSIEADKSSEELMRLRTYLPVLKEYCETGEISSALALFKRMQTTPGVILEPETYVLLLASIAENKYFCENSPPIEGAQDLGYPHSHGPGLFDDLATEMAAESLEISSSSARRLYNSLAIGFNSDNGEDTVVSTLKEVHPLMSMPIARQAAKPNELVASRVLLDRSTGICPVTNAQQRLIILEPDQRKQLHDDLLNLSTEQAAKFAGKRADDSPNRAREQLEEFSRWLNRRDGEPFTAIVDGANIGYYMQSFDKGRFNYHQIKFMVDTLVESGENPLVIVPYKYGFNEFYSTKREHQRLDQVEIQILNDLTNTGKLYRVPPRCLDDFYWMLASVSDQTESRKGQDLSVSNDDPQGRFPGARPMLISNDQMRDHRLELLEPRLFRRWYGCHIVNYNFTAFVLGESVAGNEVGFSPADFFSREIQGNRCPGNPDNEDDANWEGQAWHFPVNDWELDERFVIRIPVSR